jgi:hypothetical protein
MSSRPADQIPDVMWVNHRTDIPTWLATEIGRIAAEWSELEWQFEETIRLLMPAEIKTGRIVTNGMNMRSRITTATNLTKAHVIDGNLTQDRHDEICSIGQEIREKIEGERNQVVHGLWGRIGSGWYLLRNSGGRTLAPVGRLARSVLPQKVHMTPAKTRTIRAAIKRLSGRVDAFRAALEAELPPSPYKSPRHIRQRRLPRIRRRRGPSSPPRSSRA